MTYVLIFTALRGQTRRRLQTATAAVDRLQLLEVDLLGPTDAQIPIASASNPDGVVVPAYPVANVIDRNFTSTWVDAGFSARGNSTLLLHLNQIEEVVNYRLYTGSLSGPNDLEPVSWLFGIIRQPGDGSAEDDEFLSDGRRVQILSRVDNYNTPTDRRTVFGHLPTAFTLQDHFLAIHPPSPPTPPPGLAMTTEAQAGSAEEGCYIFGLPCWIIIVIILLLICCCIILLLCCLRRKKKSQEEVMDAWLQKRSMLLAEPPAAEEPEIEVVIEPVTRTSAHRRTAGTRARTSADSADTAAAAAGVVCGGE